LFLKLSLILFVCPNNFSSRVRYKFISNSSISGTLDASIANELNFNVLPAELYDAVCQEAPFKAGI
jgi:hypothetical protein